jgi:hypothetical protein
MFKGDIVAWELLSDEFKIRLEIRGIKDFTP